MNTDIESIAEFVVTELVNTNAIGHMAGDQWVLNKPVFGYQGDLALGSQTQAIQTLRPLFVSAYSKRAGLRVA
jgi:hypothetical protein